MFVYARPLTHASGAIAIVLNFTLILGACSAATSEPETTLTPEFTGNATISDATQTDAALSTPQFATPSGKIQCLAMDEHLRCELTTGKPIQPLPPQPDDCPLDWGNGLVLSAADGVEVLCAGDTIQISPEDITTLPYGQTWAYGGFHCTVEPIGLTCFNQRQQGFFLSTQKWNAIANTNASNRFVVGEP